MNIKNRPNHKIYIRVLRQMSSEARLLKAFELSEFSMQLFYTWITQEVSKSFR